jgi:plasmid stability protein
MAKQLTIRGVPGSVADRLAHLAKERGQSLNATVVEILENAVGFKSRRVRLERYATWTDADLAEFEDALAAQRVIDDQLWQ